MEGECCLLADAAHSGRDLHTTLIRNESAYFSCISQVGYHIISCCLVALVTRLCFHEVVKVPGMHASAGMEEKPEFIYFAGESPFTSVLHVCCCVPHWIPSTDTYTNTQTGVDGSVMNTRASKGRVVCMSVQLQLAHHTSCSDRYSLKLTVSSMDTNNFIESKNVHVSGC